jgi:hypothetical protein
VLFSLFFWRAAVTDNVGVPLGIENSNNRQFILWRSWYSGMFCWLARLKSSRTTSWPSAYHRLKSSDLEDALPPDWLKWPYLLQNLHYVATVSSILVSKDGAALRYCKIHDQNLLNRHLASQLGQDLDRISKSVLTGPQSVLHYMVFKYQFIQASSGEVFISADCSLCDAVRVLPNKNHKTRMTLPLSQITSHGKLFCSHNDVHVPPLLHMSSLLCA